MKVGDTIYVTVEGREVGSICSGVITRVDHGVYDPVERRVRKALIVKLPIHKTVRVWADEIGL